MALTDDSIMPFGKYKGTKLANVPASYLLYFYHEEKVYGDLKKYIEDNMDVLLSDQRWEGKKDTI